MVSLRDCVASPLNATKSQESADQPRPDDIVVAVETRKAEWRSLYLTNSVEEEFLFDQMVASSVRLDQCRERESLLRAYESRRARLCWEQDRELAVEEMASSLSRNPSRTRRRLTKTRQGCEWLIVQWQGLYAALQRNGEWTDPQRSLALDLLGTPRALRDDAPIEAPEMLIERELSALRHLLNHALVDLDAFERQSAEFGHAIELSRPLAQLRRFEAECLRRYEWARKELEIRRAAPFSSNSSTEADRQARDHQSFKIPYFQRAAEELATREPRPEQPFAPFETPAQHKSPLPHQLQRETFQADERFTSTTR